MEVTLYADVLIHSRLSCINDLAVIKLTWKLLKITRLLLSYLTLYFIRQLFTSSNLLTYSSVWPTQRPFIRSVDSIFSSGIIPRLLTPFWGGCLEIYLCHISRGQLGTDVLSLDHLTTARLSRINPAYDTTLCAKDILIPVGNNANNASGLSDCFVRLQLVHPLSSLFTLLFTLYTSLEPLTLESYRVTKKVYSDMWGK